MYLKFQYIPSGLVTIIRRLSSEDNYRNVSSIYPRCQPRLAARLQHSASTSNSYQTQTVSSTDNNLTTRLNNSHGA